jgi:hypothetical protein
VAREQMSWRDITEESIDHVLDVDIKGTLLCTHEFGARMLDQGHGSIVNIGSKVVVRGSARAPQYAAAKYGILGLTKSYAHGALPRDRRRRAHHRHLHDRRRRLQHGRRLTPSRRRTTRWAASWMGRRTASGGNCGAA